MSNNYNIIAPYYDRISRIVYGNNIVAAQKWLLQFIPANSTILIVGGGTGWILEELSNLHEHGLSIVYVDISAAMIALAQKRNYKNNLVEFVTAAIEDFKTNRQFDVIITAFLFDNFKEDKIKILFPKLNALLKKEGIWLYADFVHEKERSPLWQRALLKTMYLFFRLSTNIEAQELVLMDPYFSPQYKAVAEERFFKKFIRSVLYRKIS